MSQKLNVVHSYKVTRHDLFGYAIAQRRLLYFLPTNPVKGLITQMFRTGMLLAALLINACGDQSLPLNAAQAAQALSALRTSGGTKIFGRLNQPNSCRDGGYIVHISMSKIHTPMTFNTRLTDCEADNIKTSGSYIVDVPNFIIGEAVLNQDTAPEHHTGQLNFSGKITGTCVVDLNIVSSSEGPATQTGRFCGHDAALLPPP